MFNTITNENNKEHSKKWPVIPDHSYRILDSGLRGCGSRNTYVLLNLIK